MSWNFKKIGTDKEALKASVQQEPAPQSIRDEVCARIDGLTLTTNQAYLVESHGHLETDSERPFRGADTIVIRVMVLGVVNTPLAE